MNKTNNSVNLDALPIRIIIFEDNDRLRQSLAFLLQSTADYEVLGDFNNCKDAINITRVYEPDVVLMDIDMPGMNGIQAVWEIKNRFKEIKVIMLTVFEDEIKIFGAIKAGANGYLLKKDSPQKILDAIEAVHKGESPMNGMIAAKVLDYFQQSQQKNAILFEANLTEREKDILHLLIKGLSHKEACLFVLQGSMRP